MGPQLASLLLFYFLFLFTSPLIPNLFDLEPIDSRPIWYRTNLILNLADNEAIIYQIWGCLGSTFLCRRSVPLSLQSWDDRQPRQVHPLAKLVTKQVNPSSLSPSQLTMTANPSLCILEQVLSRVD
jgi:hypothetical protein